MVGIASARHFVLAHHGKSTNAPAALTNRFSSGSIILNRRLRSRVSVFQIAVAIVCFPRRMVEQGEGLRHAAALLAIHRGPELFLEWMGSRGRCATLQQIQSDFVLAVEDSGIQRCVVLQVSEGLVCSILQQCLDRIQVPVLCSGMEGASPQVVDLVDRSLSNRRLCNGTYELLSAPFGSKMKRRPAVKVTQGDEGVMIDQQLNYLWLRTTAGHVQRRARQLVRNAGASAPLKQHAGGGDVFRCHRGIQCGSIHVIPRIHASVGVKEG
mmetsp:Transcript_63695/g.170564  ORF Transcript_63695/g.170564 Transcript_63695/m.170564 type:complete len:268 (-) Transcript_63695:1686-2489(-)